MKDIAVIDNLITGLTILRKYVSEESSDAVDVSADFSVAVDDLTRISEEDRKALYDAFWYPVRDGVNELEWTVVRFGGTFDYRVAPELIYWE